MTRAFFWRRAAECDFHYRSWFIPGVPTCWNKNKANSSLCLITHDEMKAYSGGDHLQLPERRPFKHRRSESSVYKIKYLSPRLEVHTGLCWGNLRERDHLEDPGVDGRIILNGYSGSWMGGMDWIYVALDMNRWRACSCKCGNELPGSIKKTGNFLTSWGSVSFSSRIYSPLFDGFLFLLFVQLQQVTFSYLFISFLYKIFYFAC